LGVSTYRIWSGKRLPTEAECEYAARGGMIGKKFPFGDQIDSAKVDYGRKNKGILKVGSFPPNGYGMDYLPAGLILQLASAE
jgi:formylglycine-generating enzyme required for sulfatase activity